MADTKTRASRATSLLIEPTGSVVVDGRRIKLPPMSFALIKALAERPGSGFASSELPDLAWPGFHLVQKDVHWHIWQTRKLIGDLERANADRLISSRPHFGYFINLPASAIAIQEIEAPSVQQVIVLPDADTDEIQVVPAPTPTPAQADETPVSLHSVASGDTDVEMDPIAEEPIDIDEKPVPLNQEPLPTFDSAPKDVISRAPTRLRLKTALVAAATAIGIAALATLAARSGAEPPAPPSPTEQAAEPQVTQSRRDARADKPQRATGSRSEKRRRTTKVGDRSRSGSSAQQVVTATVPETSEAPAPPMEKRDESDKEAVAALPPAPSNHLFHLHNPDTGDNFVTTDPNAVSDYEGRGYIGGSVGRVYARPEDGTKPISTNGGIAYIFTNGGAKTDPAIRLLPLYYASKDGDFFYTTDREQASADGWGAALVGYVGAP